jgi:hypothetical protein
MATVGELRRYLRKWEAGDMTKSDIDTELGHPNGHGKWVTGQWRSILGVETEQEHRLVAENRRLKGLLDTNGIQY